jgi:hypothetical protein
LPWNHIKLFYLSQPLRSAEKVCCLTPRACLPENRKSCLPGPCTLARLLYIQLFLNF